MAVGAASRTARLVCIRRISSAVATDATADFPRPPAALRLASCGGADCNWHRPPRPRWQGPRRSTNPGSQRQQCGRRKRKAHSNGSRSQWPASRLEVAAEWPWALNRSDIPPHRQHRARTGWTTMVCVAPGRQIAEIERSADVVVRPACIPHQLEHMGPGEPGWSTLAERRSCGDQVNRRPRPPAQCGVDEKFDCPSSFDERSEFSARHCGPKPRRHR